MRIRPKIVIISGERDMDIRFISSYGTTEAYLSLVLGWRRLGSSTGFKHTNENLTRKFSLENSSS